MKAALLKSYGDIDQFMIDEVPMPKPEAGEVLIKIEASAVNPFDLILHQGYMAQFIPLELPAVTGHGDVPMAVDSMKKGAPDCIQKPFKEDQLIECMLERAKDTFATHQQSASCDALLSKLTSREGQVLERIVTGRLNKQVADDLGISIKTVEAHRANI